jgi:hypothetical protein
MKNIIATAIFAMTASSLPASAAVLFAEFDADTVSTGDSSWVDTVSSSSLTFTNGNNNTARTATVTSMDPSPATNIDSAVVFDGTIRARQGGQFLNDDTASFEVFFRPDVLAIGGNQTIAESGGSGLGTGIGLTGSTLRAASAGGDEPQLDFDLTPLIAGGEFIQAVYVLDADADPSNAEDRFTLYVNGQRVAGTTDDPSNISGNNNFAIGSSDGTAKNVPNGDFTGEIALVRFYSDALDASEVQASYNAVVIPEPASALAGIAGLGLLGLRRRKA